MNPTVDYEKVISAMKEIQEQYVPLSKALAKQIKKVKPSLTKGDQK